MGITSASKAPVDLDDFLDDTSSRSMDWNQWSQTTTRFSAGEASMKLLLSPGNQGNATFRMGHLHYKLPICPLFSSWASKKYLKESKVQSAFLSRGSSVFWESFVELCGGWVLLYWDKNWISFCFDLNQDWQVFRRKLWYKDFKIGAVEVFLSKLMLKVVSLYALPLKSKNELIEP